MARGLSGALEGRLHAEKAAYFVRPVGIHRVSLPDVPRFQMENIGTAGADKLRVVRDDVYSLAALVQCFQKLCHLPHVAVLSADLSRSHTVRAFSDRFGVSESSIKNYFSGVFGQSISRYTTHKRMVHAAGLLEGTDLPIIEVAGSVGYESQSKFASAFHREYGASHLRLSIEKRKRYPVVYNR